MASTQQPNFSFRPPPNLATIGATTTILVAFQFAAYLYLGYMMHIFWAQSRQKHILVVGAGENWNLFLTGKPALGYKASNTAQTSARNFDYLAGPIESEP